MISRRRLITGFVIALTPLGATPSAQEYKAQRGEKVPRVGILWPGSAPDASRPGYQVNIFRRQFEQGLHQQGWVEGQTVHIERRYADGKLERLPDLAAELVSLDVDVIFAPTSSATRAAMRATQTIPIVMNAADPVGQGFVSSLARPDRNVTGLGVTLRETAGKRLELLKEALPRASRIAVLRCPGGLPAATPGSFAYLSVDQWQTTQDAARALKIELLPLDIQGRDDLRTAFEAASRQRAAGLVVFDCSLFNAIPTAMLVEHRLPAIYIWPRFAEAGGLMAYGTDEGEMGLTIARYIDKILRGSKPSELPVAQPTKYRLVINLKTAKALGLTIPPSLLARADQVIE